MLSIIRLFFRLLPTKKMIIFESVPDFSDNAEALYRFFIKKNVHKKYKIVWFFNKECVCLKEKNVVGFLRDQPGFLNQVRQVYYLTSARYIFDSNSCVGLQRRDQIRIHLGHGMPIKAPREYCSHAGQMTNILTTSPYFEAIYCDLFKVQAPQILPLGLPRNDYLFSYDKEKKNSMFQDHKVLFFMPTYRQHKNGKPHLQSESKLSYGIPCIETKEDLEILKETAKQHHCQLLFRLHPAQDTSFISECFDESLIHASDDYLRMHNINLYQLLAMSDALITDYSSVYYDYLLTGRPIALTINDLENYRDTFELALNYKEEIVGEYVMTLEDLNNFIICCAKNNDDKKSARQHAKEKFHQFSDDQSCQRLYDYLINDKHF